jgi:hypothetical protein
MIDMPYFSFWCYKVLPLVYDNSLSYYEILCKVVTYINELIEQDKIFGYELTNLLKELEKVKEWINNFDTSFIEELIKKYIATMILVEISDSGYIVYNIPESWKDIVFNTTGLDIKLGLQPEYGHLVLSY